MNEELLKAFLEPLRVCLNYKPTFGSKAKSGLDLDGFKARYGEDVFYDLIGLATAPIYVAHKAMGGMTSFYRQLGISCERLTRSVLVEGLGLDREQVIWHYRTDGIKGTEQKLTLDARLAPGEIDDLDARKRVEAWLIAAALAVGTDVEVAQNLKGAVFEIRQGYKSADSKRQNADIGFGVRALKEGYLPCLLVFSGQVSESVVRRYRSQGLYVILGSHGPLAHENAFKFFRDTVGWDLEAWLSENQEILRSEIGRIVTHLLAP